MSPTDFRYANQTFVLPDVTMRLSTAAPLSPETTAIWEGLTGKRILDEADTTLSQTSDLERIQAFVDLVSQTPPYELDSPSQSPSTAGRRRLQDSLVIVFNVFLQIRTNATSINLRSYVEGAFDENDRQDYAVDLRTTGRPELRRVTFSGIELPAVANPSSGSSGATIGIIAVTVIVVLVVIALAGYYLLVYRKERHQDNNIPPEISSPTSGDGIQEIDVARPTDVSTLGDPIPPGHHKDTIPPEGSVAEDTTSLDYDYRRAYIDSGPSLGGSASSGSTNPNNVVAKDDVTLDAQYFADDHFEVEAPPGMLGLVLETSTDGVPTVHAIKSTSPLVEQVRQGDRLLSVDGEDVTVMLASDVSKLIAQKKDNPVRRFVFAKPNTKAMAVVAAHAIVPAGR